MTLPSGTRLGVYEVTAPIGEGGMGQVYRATDTKLKRQVAIKILPPLLATDPDRLARFQREAEVLASLNHPHIAAIYGLEDAGGVKALVMELVEGEDLSQRIARGAMPVDEALPIARQIAEALEAAHEQSIVHRDLKPANIKVRADGTVKVLDFGLAKAIERGSGIGERGSGDAMTSPTITTPAMTQAGMILGTAAYMSPEQARGRAVDKRSDIWAFGAVLYEMLSGERAFKGDDVSETLASILKDTPSFDSLPAGTPLRLTRLLERCLDRDVKQRLRDIGEARVEVARIQSGAPDLVAGTPAAIQPRRRALSEWIAWSVAAIGMAASLALVYGRRTGDTTTNTAVVRLPFVPPATVTATGLNSTIVSPDGQKLVFSGRSSDGRQLLWVRPLDSLEAQPLPDTEDAIEPFWSADSRSVAFGAQGKLKRVDLAGGRAQSLTDAARLVGGAWSSSGVIVFGPDFRSPLFRVSANGGERAPATPLNPARGDAGARYPAFLPDGRHFLYYSDRGTTRAVLIGSIDSMDVKELLPDDAPAVYVRPGWLLYIRNGALVAHAFDATRLELTGEPLLVATGSTRANVRSGGRFSASENGVLVVQDAPMYDYQLVWFDRTGKQVGALGPVVKVAVPQMPRLSPDGKRVVVQQVDAQQRQALWIADLSRGTFDRFTTGFAQSPVWTPDGRSVIAGTFRNGVNGVYRLSVAGGDDQLVVKGTVFPSDVSPDGKWVFYTQRGDKTRMDMWAQPLSGGQQAGSREPLINSEFDEDQPQVSPDGRWLAYMSDVTGSFQIYVRPLTADGKLGEASRVSTGGGSQPRWGRDGRELFYIVAPQGSTSSELVAVPVKTSGGTFEPGVATTLFKVPVLRDQISRRDYDVALDSQRFLVGTVVNEATATPVTIVLNWLAGLKNEPAVAR